MDTEERPAFYLDKNIPFKCRACCTFVKAAGLVIMREWNAYKNIWIGEH